MLFVSLLPNLAHANNPMPVDLLIKNGHILTMNKEKQIFENGLIAINKNKIVAISDGSDFEKFKPKEIIDVNGDIVMPGLINTHTHASMTVFRSLADDVPDRLHRYIFPLEKQLVSREMVRIGAQLGNVEMLRGGVTTYADMYYFEDEVAKTVHEIGMRAILGETIIDFPVASAKTPEEGIANTVKFVEAYYNHPRITPAFAPHGPYTNSTENLQKITELSKKYDVPVMTHLAESDKESEVIAQRANGKSPVEYLAEIGVLTPNFIGAHVINVDDEDIALLKKHDVGIAHNMSANIKSAKGVSPALKMFDQGLRIGLGTDGPMSGNTLSTIDEMNQVAKVHKLVNKDRAAMPPIKVVEMATIGAAKALHMEDEIGSLEVGKLADIIVIDTTAPNMVPLYNPYSVLVYSTYANNVRHAIVDGKPLMLNWKLTTVDEKKIRQEAQAFADKVRETVVKSGEVIQ